MLKACPLLPVPADCVNGVITRPTVVDNPRQVPSHQDAVVSFCKAHILWMALHCSWLVARRKELSSRNHAKA